MAVLLGCFAASQNALGTALFTLMAGFSRYLDVQRMIYHSVRISCFYYIISPIRQSRPLMTRPSRKFFRLVSIPSMHTFQQVLHPLFHMFRSNDCCHIPKSEDPSVDLRRYSHFHCDAEVAIVLLHHHDIAAEAVDDGVHHAILEDHRHRLHLAAEHGEGVLLVLGEVDLVEDFFTLSLYTFQFKPFLLPQENESHLYQQ